MSGYGRQQICRKTFINRYEVPLLREFRKGREVRLNHGLACAVLVSVRSASRTALRITAEGAGSPVHISHFALPSDRNISRPDTVSMPRLEASCKSLVVTGR